MNAGTKALRKLTKAYNAAMTKSATKPEGRA